MKYPQLPQLPSGLTPGLRQWLDAATKMLRTAFGSGADGLVTRGELAGTGLVDISGGTIVIPPAGGVTTPPTVTGLTATGAMASIFLQWDAPTFANLAYIEILRSDSNDFGTAYPVGTTVRGINIYPDNVGSGATKYYWVRAVSKAGVKGPVGGSAVRGTTGYDPAYVMSVLTSGIWTASTAYEPFQYVRPTTGGSFQYVCVDGGTSGSTEPTWPVVVGATVADGTCEWKCEALTSRVPFAIGTVDGQPAVSILNAFIQDASITNAKVHDLAVDKLTAGTIAAISINLGGFLWNGFDTFANPSNVAGYWFGMNGSTPAFKLWTGAAGGNKGLVFDGDNLTITGDGRFDDVFGDSARFNLLSANYVNYTDRVVPSDFITEHGLDINNPDYNKYLCATPEVFKTTHSTVLLVGTVYFVFAPTGYFVFDPTATSPVYLKTPYIAQVMAYDDGDTASVLRFKRHCSFVGQITNLKSLFAATGITSCYLNLYFGVHGGTEASESVSLDSHKVSIAAATEASPHTITFASAYNGNSVSIDLWSDGSGSVYFQCDDTNAGLPYLKVYASQMAAEIQYSALYRGAPPFAYSSGTTTFTHQIFLQMWKPEYVPASSVTSDARLY